MYIKKTRCKYWHLPIFTPRSRSTIFDITELNLRVRHGNGCTLCVIDTNYLGSVQNCTIIGTRNEHAAQFTALCDKPLAGAVHQNFNFIFPADIPPSKINIPISLFAVFSTRVTIANLS